MTTTKKILLETGLPFLVHSLLVGLAITGATLACLLRALRGTRPIIIIYHQLRSLESGLTTTKKILLETGLPFLVHSLLVGLAITGATKTSSAATMIVFGFSSLIVGLFALGSVMQFKRRVALSLLLIHTAMNLSVIANVHWVLGRDLTVISDHSSPVKVHDAIYFSIVTLTTLGYGDFQPLECVRMLAAIQALFGYVLLGLIVAIIARENSREYR